MRFVLFKKQTDLNPEIFSWAKQDLDPQATRIMTASLVLPAHRRLDTSLPASPKNLADGVLSTAGGTPACVLPMIRNGGASPATTRSRTTTTWPRRLNAPRARVAARTYFGRGRGVVTRARCQAPMLWRRSTTCSHSHFVNALSPWSSRRTNSFASSSLPQSRGFTRSRPCLRPFTSAGLRGSLCALNRCFK